MDTTCPFGSEHTTMNVDRFKADHHVILQSIQQLRTMVHSGVVANAAAIASRIVGMSAKIKIHLTAEDASLYPHLARSSDPETVKTGRALQGEMGHLAKAYGAFASKWNVAAAITSQPDVFKQEASEVFSLLMKRIKIENNELYPLAEAI
jgi:hemerythrin-like domain-containing protein